MYYKISSCGIETEIRRDQKPTEQQAKRVILNIKKSEFLFSGADMHERIDFYRELDESTVNIEYAGEDNKNEYTERLKNADPETRAIYNEMEKLFASGSPLVRKSKRNGTIIFADGIGQPRWDSQGEWMSSEGAGIILNNPKQAREQLDYVLATDEEKKNILNRNFLKMQENHRMVA